MVFQGNVQTKRGVLLGYALLVVQMAEKCNTFLADGLYVARIGERY